MSLDFEIVDINISLLEREDIIKLANKYKVKVPNDPKFPTRDLRKLLANIKSIFVQAQKDADLRLYLEDLFFNDVCSEEVKSIYPQLKEYCSCMEPIYEDVPTDNDTFLSPELKINDQGDLNIYQNKDIILHESVHNITNLQHNSLDNKDKGVGSDLKTNVFQTTENKNQQQNVSLQPVVMAQAVEQIPMIKPNIFSGETHENPLEFLEKFLICKQIHHWSDLTCVNLFGTYLTNYAYKWYSTFIHKNPGVSWDDIQRGFKEAFGKTNLLLDLQTTLESRIQAPHETCLQYFYVIQNLCKQVDPRMSEKTIISYCIKGLLPEFFDQVMYYENDTLNDLQDNLSKIEVKQHLKSQNARKFNMHYNLNAHGSPQTFQNVTGDYETRFKHINNQVSFQNNNNDGLMNTITNIQKKLSELTLNQDRRSRRDISPHDRSSRHRSPRQYSRDSTPSFRSRERYRSPLRKNVDFNKSTSRSNSPYRHNLPMRGYNQTRHFNYHYKSRNDSSQQNDRKYKKFNCEICFKNNHSTVMCYFNPRNRRQLSNNQSSWRNPKNGEDLGKSTD